MTRESTNGHPQRLPACNSLPQRCFITFSYKSLAGFPSNSDKVRGSESRKRLGFLRLTAVSQPPAPS